MSDGCSSGPVVLTLAGPRPFLLVLVLHCPGRVRFFEILVIISYYLLDAKLTILFQKINNSMTDLVTEEGSHMPCMG